MPDSRANTTVRIVDANGDPDMTVAVIGDQVVDLTGAATGDVLAVQPDGTVAPDPLNAPTVHFVRLPSDPDDGEPAFVNSWVNYGAPFGPAGFWRDVLGVVHLEGIVKNGITNDVFTLPVGFRPISDSLFAVDSNNDYGEVWVAATGLVKAVTGNATFYSLNGITFRAA